MRNIIISLPEKVARWARVWAAEHDTSVAKMLGSFLEEKMESELHYTQAMRNFLSRQPERLKRDGHSYPTRERLHLL